MKLRNWRENNGLTHESVARRVGAGNGSVVSKWERGAQVPTRLFMVRIYLLTEGQVQPNDFFDLPVQPEARAA